MTENKLTRRDFNQAAAATVATVVASAPGTARAQMTASGFDIAILNGRVMDPETGFDEIANVGVKDGRIVEITKEAITGGRIIEARSLVVAPGFIDTHYHWPRPSCNTLDLLDNPEPSTHGPSRSITG